MTPTRQRLLECACNVFAEKGFQDANVTDICCEAGANIAAINYHFGNKQKFYEEVFAFAAALAEREIPLLADPGTVPDPKARLAFFIRGQFERGFSSGLASCIDRIVVHEMTSPTASHELFFETVVRPRRAHLVDVLRALLPPEASEGHVRVCLHNIVSLFAFHHFIRLHSSGPPSKNVPPLPPPEIMAEHATAFALGGIQSIAQLPHVDAPACAYEGHEKDLTA